MSNLRAGKEGLNYPSFALRPVVALLHAPTYTLPRAFKRYIKSPNITILLEVIRMRWEKPSYNDLRFGFEVTMYIYNR